MLTLEGVTKQYFYGSRLFGAADFEFADGEIVALFGQKGGGKTSFLKSIAGVEECEGEVKLNGKKINPKTDDVIMMFDDGAVFKFKSVFDNLSYPLKLRGYDKVRVAQSVIAVSEQLGLRACLYSRAFNLSEVEKCRLAAARLFLRPASLLLIDEPTFRLDEEEAESVFRDILSAAQSAAEKGATVIYATSNRERAFRYADRVIVLVDGEIKGVGNFAEQWRNPRSLWAAEAVDEYYNCLKGVLSVEKNAVKFTFGENIVIDLSVLGGKIVDGYDGKEVYIGWHSQDSIEGEIFEKASVFYHTKDGLLCQTERGIFLPVKDKTDSVFYAPNPSAVVIFDGTNENSIMRKL